MKRYMGMRSPDSSMELRAEGLRRGERKRQQSGQAWDSSTASNGTPRRIFPDQSPSAGIPASLDTTLSGPVAAPEAVSATGDQRFGMNTRSSGPVVTENGPWTEEEDAVLREGVLRFGTQAWDKVANHLLPPVTGGPQKRKAADCSARWDAVVRHTAVKGPWLPEEDALLRQHVAKFGPKRWALIATHIPGRAGKQCRERWLNHLDTRVIKSDWTPEEDGILLDAQQRVGNKWSEIARLLPGRAENAVKNRFNSLITKRLTHGIEVARAAGVVDGKYGEAALGLNGERHFDDYDDAEEANIELKSPQEILALMFRRIGESDHVATRIPDIRVTPEKDDMCELEIGEYDDEQTPLSLKLDTRPATAGSATRVSTAKPIVKSPETELQCLNLAHRFWGQERERNDLFQRVAFSNTEWDDLEAKAARRATENPNDVAAATAAATAALGDSFLPPKHALSPQLGGSSHHHADPLRSSSLLGNDPQLRGLVREAPASKMGDADEVAVKLSGTLCSLSLDDASWLGDIIDASFDHIPRGIGKGDAKMSWNPLSPRTSQTSNGGGRAAPRNASSVKMSGSIEDWGTPLIGSSFAGQNAGFEASLDRPTSPMATTAPAAACVPPQPESSPQSDAAVRTTLHDMNMRARNNFDPITAISDTSMSLDNVDWDLILKMSSAPRSDQIAVSTEQKPESSMPPPLSSEISFGDLTQQQEQQQNAHHKVVGIDPSVIAASLPLDENELTPRARQLLSLVMRDQRK
ncbi:hypothetical protein CTAYLR_003645 [Chrysophaeum taylorii]|uniref:Uncharacterized protein n=1 Tax=Chrysophaeum taylorii TaxID=2483200 RepID=A0AAD7UEB3_9STRA|nr:hypothetical protein CTAYLR_003645 [Chrysophaeum taylorii]